MNDEMETPENDFSFDQWDNALSLAFSTSTSSGSVASSSPAPPAVGEFSSFISTPHPSLIHRTNTDISSISSPSTYVGPVRPGLGSRQNSSASTRTYNMASFDAAFVKKTTTELNIIKVDLNTIKGDVAGLKRELTNIGKTLQVIVDNIAAINFPQSNVTAASTPRTGKRDAAQRTSPRSNENIAKVFKPEILSVNAGLEQAAGFGDLAVIWTRLPGKRAVNSYLSTTTFTTFLDRFVIPRLTPSVNRDDNGNLTAAALSNLKDEVRVAAENRAGDRLSNLRSKVKKLKELPTATEEASQFLPSTMILLVYPSLASKATINIVKSDIALYFPAILVFGLQCWLGCRFSAPSKLFDEDIVAFPDGIRAIFEQNVTKPNEPAPDDLSQMARDCLEACLMCPDFGQRVKTDFQMLLCVWYTIKCQAAMPQEYLPFADQAQRFIAKFKEIHWRQQQQRN